MAASVGRDPDFNWGEDDSEYYKVRVYSTNIFGQESFNYAECEVYNFHDEENITHNPNLKGGFEPRDISQSSSSADVPETVQSASVEFDIVLELSRTQSVPPVSHYQVEFTNAFGVPAAAPCCASIAQTAVGVAPTCSCPADTFTAWPFDYSVGDEVGYQVVAINANGRSEDPLVGAFTLP